MTNPLDHPAAKALQKWSEENGLPKIGLLLTEPEYEKLYRAFLAGWAAAVEDMKTAIAKEG